MSALESLDQRAVSLISLLQTGPANFLEPAISLFSKLAVLEIALFGILFAAGRTSNMGDVVVRLMKLGAFFWFIRDFPGWQGTILSGFQWAGLALSGQDVTRGTEALLPSAFLEQGFTAWGAVRQCGSGLSFLSADAATLIVLAFIGLLLFLGLLWMGITAVLTILEYYLVTAIAFILLPFAAFSPTAFVAEKTFSSFIALGVKAATITVISGFILADLNGLLNDGALCSAGGSATEILRTVGVLLASAVFYLVLLIYAPRLAAGALTGSASLGAGAAAMAAFGLVGVTAGAAYGGVKTAGALVHGGRAAIGGAHGTASAVSAAAAGTRAAAAAGAASMGDVASPRARAGGAVAGVAAYAAQSATAAVDMSAVGKHFREQTAKTAAQQASAVRSAVKAVGTANRVRQAGKRLQKLDQTENDGERES